MKKQTKSCSNIARGNFRKAAGKVAGNKLIQAEGVVQIIMGHAQIAARSFGRSANKASKRLV